ncbi:MAG: hypothetical protein ACREHD_21005, partial [Pirellulales bacterium]
MPIGADEIHAAPAAYDEQTRGFTFFRRPPPQPIGKVVEIEQAAADFDHSQESVLTHFIRFLGQSPPRHGRARL